MTKTEILEAINATIIPNDKQGITADSLNNILTEIVNAMSEGSGGSGASGYYIDFTRANPDDGDSTELTADAMAHNVQLYSSLMTVYNTGNMAAAGPVSTCLPNMGIITSNAVMIDTDAITVVFALPTGLGNVKINAEDMSTGDATTIAIGPFITMAIVLLPDGSVQLDIPGFM